MYVNDRYKEQCKAAGIRSQYDTTIIMTLHCKRGSSEYDNDFNLILFTSYPCRFAVPYIIYNSLLWPEK